MLTPMPSRQANVTGMDDNATGLGIMLELAEHLKMRLPSMVFDLSDQRRGRKN